MQILCIGEGLIEMDHTAPDPNGVEQNAPSGFAGEALATAWYLRRLVPADWSVGFLTRLGQDAGSDALAGYIRRAGLLLCPVPPDPRRSVGRYVMVRDAGRRRFCHWLADSAARGLMREADAVRAALGAADHVILGGDMLAALPLADCYALLALLADAGRPLTLVPGSRLSLWPDAATARQVIGVAAALAQTVLAQADAERKMFHDASPLATAARYARIGAAQVVVVQSDARAVLAVDGQLTALPAEGAGASPEGYHAGFVAALLQGATPAGACALASQVARRVALRVGAA